MLVDGPGVVPVIRPALALSTDAPPSYAASAVATAAPAYTIF